MAETGLTKQRIIADLTKSAHGKLDQYLAVGVPASREDAEFFAHLVAWSGKTSELKDVRVALPVIALNTAAEPEFVDNALAHIADLDPILFARAVKFAATSNGRRYPSHVVRRLVERYLRDLEADRRAFDRTALQHRVSLRKLYGFFHVKPADFADAIVMKRDGYPAGSVFDLVSRLHRMEPLEAASVIVKYKVPFLVAAGAMKGALKTPDVVLAIIKAMSPTELVTNTKMLERLGVKSEPALRAAYDEALGKAAGAKRPKATFKTTRAAEQQDDPALKAKLLALQEKQLDKMSVEGDWLVLADKSGSMHAAIDMSCQIAAVLSRMAKGNVDIVFFDSAPRHVAATGKTYDELKAAVRHITANGQTSIGCGLQWALDRGTNVDGIAIISDGAENTAPAFSTVYPRLAAKLGKVPPVYLYLLEGDSGNALMTTCRQASIDVHEFDLRQQKVDYYSLPQLITTMRTQRYGLVDEVMETPLKVLDDVLKNTKGVEVYRGSRVAAY